MGRACVVLSSASLLSFSSGHFCEQPLSACAREGVCGHLSTSTLNATCEKWQPDICDLLPTLFICHIMDERGNKTLIAVLVCTHKAPLCPNVEELDPLQDPLPGCTAQISGPWLGCDGGEHCLIIRQLQGRSGPTVCGQGCICPSTCAPFVLVMIL